MNKIKGALKNHLLERPFDFYVAFLLFLVGWYSIFSDHWPEDISNAFVSTIISIISVYYLVASVVIMLSLGCRRRRWPVLSLMGEMYGWLFIAAASCATVLIYIGSVFAGGPRDVVFWLLMVSIWLGLFVSSTARFIDLYSLYRGVKKRKWTLR